MSKFKVRLKITGFELEVEGSREDVPLIGQNIARQIAGAIEPASAIVEGETLGLPGILQNNGVAKNETPVGPKRRTAPRKTNTTRNDASAALDWVHDPSQWGMPQQSWSNTEKAIWLLHVADKSGVTREMTLKQVVSTFAKHYRQAKPISHKNIARDLGNAKLDGLVVEDTTKDPPTWYLIDKGITTAEALVLRGKGTEANT